MILSNYNHIFENNCSNNDGYGISLFDSNYNTLSNNTVSLNSEHGIYLKGSSYNTLCDNIVTLNSEHGIYLSGSNNNILSNNTMMEDGIFIQGDQLNHWNSHTIDISNTINGKPVYYWKNQTSGTVPSGAGEVILANCTGITVENQNVSGGSVGIEIVYSSNITLSNNTISNNSQQGISLYFSNSCLIHNNTIKNNDFGIDLYNSGNCTIENNICSLNDGYGIFLYHSGNNTLINNTVSLNGDHGIYYRGRSDNNTLINNTVSLNSEHGICLSDSNYNTLSNNTVSLNSKLGIYYVYASYNTLSNNTVSLNSEHGIYLGESSYNTLCDNIVFSNNDGSGIHLSDSSNNTLSNNNISNNDGSGIRLTSSSTCTITNNNCSNNRYGINLYRSSHCALTNNTMNENGIFIYGRNLENWNSHIVEITNTVNGKPVYYYKNVTGFTVPSGAGQVILANCSRIFVENQNCSNGSVGISVVYSSNISIENNTCSDNDHYGIFLFESNNNTLTNNTISNNREGIFLKDSSICTIKNNTCSSNNRDGIRLDDSNDCTIKNNTCSNNHEGIYLQDSNDCTITNNTLSGNRAGILLVDNSRDNTAHYNNIYNNTEYGIDAIENNDCSIDARYNWWGNNSGPYHPNKNPGGTGDNVTDYVRFDPWVGKKNRKPEIITENVIECYEDIEYFVDYNATDEENDTLTWSLQTNATFLIISSETGILNGTPAQKDVGTCWVNVTVSDSNGMDYHNFTLNVIEVNEKPIITTTDIITAIEDTNYSVIYNATDEENDTLIWSLQTNATFLNINNETGILNGTPQQNDVGTYLVNVTVSDGELLDYHNFTFTVINVNDPPELTIISPDNDTTVKWNLTITGTASDIDSEIESVEIRLDNGDWLLADGTTEWSFTFNTTELVNGRHNISVRVTDGELNTTVALEVTVENPAPEPARPDFLVSNLDITITGPNMVGKENTITVTVHNAGEEDGKVRVLVYLNDENNDSLLLNLTLDIASGAFSETPAVAWTPEKEGDATIIVVLKDESAVAEEITDNNRAETRINIEKEEKEDDDGEFLSSFEMAAIIAGFTLMVGGAVWFWKRD